MGYRYRSDDELKDSGVEWLGKIPKDWEVRQLKRVLSDRKENNEPIKTSNILSLTIEKGVIPYSEKGTGGNKAKEDLTQYKLVYPNDIVLNSMNVIVGAVGLSKYFGCASPAYYMLYKINANDDIRFYNYIFKSKLFQDSLKGLGNGIMMKQSETSGKLNTIRMRIPMEKLSSVKIPIAFNLDQEKIANFLDEKTSQFDSIISKKEKLIERLEEAKKSLISEVVTGKVKVVKTDDGYELIKRSSEEMKDSGVEWLGEIPKEWDIKRLRFLGKLQNGISKSSDSFGYGYPFVSYSNVYRNIELPHIVEGLVNSTEE
ncbi:restriction endonuclease subunit S [Clostridioides difficile]